MANRKSDPLEYYIRDEEKAANEYELLAEVLLELGRKDLADIVFGIAFDESKHRLKLLKIREALL